MSDNPQIQPIDLLIRQALDAMPQFNRDYSAWENSTDELFRYKAKHLKAYRDAIKKQAPRICKQYGVPCEYEYLREIYNAEQHNAACEGCDGHECKRTVTPYCKNFPVFRDGKLNIATVPCEFGKRRNFSKRLKNSNLPKKFMGKTFDDYNVTADNERAVKVAHWYCDKFPAQSLYLYGGTGTGKTFLATIVAQHFLNEGSVIFGDVPTLLDAIKQTFDGAGSSYEVVRRYMTCKLLILDDLGTGKITDWNVGILYQIINNRYNNDLPLIVTSNYDLNALRGRLTVRDKNGVDDFAAKRIISRLSEMCLGVSLGNNDNRRQP